MEEPEVRVGVVPSRQGTIHTGASWMWLARCSAAASILSIKKCSITSEEIAMMESAREEALREKTTATTANFRCRLYRPMRLRLARRPRTRAGPIAREEVGKSCGSLTTQRRNREANLASF